MFLKHGLILVIIGTVIHLIFFFIENDSKTQSTLNEKHNVIIGILSSRQHFQQRKLIRNGIKKQNTSLNVGIKFILGKYPCRVPVEDRIGIFKCEASVFLKPEFHRFHFQSLHNKSDRETFVPDGPIGIDFIVNHKIIFHDFGLYDHNGDGFKGILKVLLYETPTKKFVSSKTFLPFGERGAYNGYHVYKHRTALTLPKGFRGTLVVEGVSENDSLIKSKHCLISDGGGLISYVHGYRYGFEEGVFPQYVDNEMKSLWYFCGPSFIFSSFDVPPDANASLLSIKRNKRYDEINEEIELNATLLEAEQKEHDDLLFVDVVESYRKLPEKMLLFYEWLHDKNFDFVLKTDDDCFINITGISHFLEGLNLREKVWIGNFRMNFLVNLFGKWEETEYISTTYPPFACGSGYILSNDIVQWIYMNRLHLKCYQGEDVSLGIWLSAIDINLVMDPRFQCSNNKKNNIFSSPDHNLTSLKYLYGLRYKLDIV